jgi:hypothetical protein
MSRNLIIFTYFYVYESTVVENSLSKKNLFWVCGSHSNEYEK